MSSSHNGLVHTSLACPELLSADDGHVLNAPVMKRRLLWRMQEHAVLCLDRAAHGQILRRSQEAHAGKALSE